MPKILKPITILKTIGEVPEVTKEFLEAQVIALRKALDESERKVIDQQFDIDRANARIDIVEQTISEYNEIISQYKKIIEIDD